MTPWTTTRLPADLTVSFTTLWTLGWVGLLQLPADGDLSSLYHFESEARNTLLLCNLTEPLGQLPPRSGGDNDGGNVSSLGAPTISFLSLLFPPLSLEISTRPV